MSDIPGAFQDVVPPPSQDRHALVEGQSGETGDLSSKPYQTGICRRCDRGWDFCGCSQGPDLDPAPFLEVLAKISR